MSGTAPALDTVALRRLMAQSLLDNCPLPATGNALGSGALAARTIQPGNAQPTNPPCVCCALDRRKL